MRRQGLRGTHLRGVRRGKVVRTTISDSNEPCPLDKVNQQFKVDRPNQLWVSDFTYVSTWQGWLYVAFVIDSLEQALHARQPARKSESSVGSRGDSYDNATPSRLA